MKENKLIDLSKQFAVDIVNLCTILVGSFLYTKDISSTETFT